MDRTRFNAWLVAVLVAVGGTLAGCKEAPREAGVDRAGSGSGAQPSGRHWLGELTLERSIGESPDVVLGLPILLTAGPDGGFALVDLADRAVRAFDGEGRERWAFGREGEGPGEFLNVIDLLFRPDGSVALLDSELQRVTLISGEGDLLSTTRLPDPSRRLLPSHTANDDDWVLVPHDLQHLWVSVSRDGQRTGSKALPAELHVEHPLIIESFSANAETGAIIAFRWSSRLLFLDGNGNVRTVTSGVEQVEFPTVVTPIPGVTRIDPEATPAARDVSAALGQVFVLFRGSGIDGGVVDVYDEESMSYHGSYQVPRDVSNIAALADGRLATLQSDSVPTVRIWSLGG